MVVSSETPLHVLADFGPALGVSLDRLAEQVEDDGPLFSSRPPCKPGTLPALRIGAFVDQQRDVAAVVDDLIGAGAVAEIEGALGTPPVFLERLALPGEDGNARPDSQRCPSARRRQPPRHGPAC